MRYNMDVKMRFGRSLCITALLIGYAAAAAAGSVEHGNAKKSRSHKRPSPEKRNALSPANRFVKIGGDAKVSIPSGYHVKKAEMREYKGTGFVARLFSRSFSQGDCAYLEVLPEKGGRCREEFRVSAKFDEKEIPLLETDWGYRGLFPIPPDMSAGRKRFEISTGSNRGKTYRYECPISERSFEVYRSSMDLGKYSNADYLKDRPDLVEQIERNSKKKELVMSQINQDFISGPLSHPRNEHKITSTFYAKRITENYILKDGKKISKEPSVNYHRGVDLKGLMNAPVYAVASGIVVIAEEMYYEGNHTVIDHGQGVFTRYMHQNKIIVHNGQYVRGGQVIGYCGETGMVTGPHLHISLYIRGVYVDPLSMLSLPIRD